MVIPEKILGYFRRKPKYPPPPYPPPNTSPNDTLPPLKQVQLPMVQPEHQFALSNLGWTTITFPDTPADPFRQSLETLFEASKAFFALSIEYKSTFATTEGSEEGWSRIEGEKELITLRSTENCPKELRDAVGVAWAEAGKVLNEMLGKIAGSLGLPPEALTAYSSPCAEFQKERTATMLRMFRYEGHEKKTVAEPHADLGLLSFVMGDTPGLEVWNRYLGLFWPIEKSYIKPAGSVLVGRQLERLSNGRYVAGGHRVQAYGVEQQTPPVKGPDQSSERPYRYSIVFVLRAHSPVPIDTNTLTTEITGPVNRPLKCTAGELFSDIKRIHFNINTGVKEREEQKKELRERNELSERHLVPQKSR